MFSLILAAGLLLTQPSPAPVVPVPPAPAEAAPAPAKKKHTIAVPDEAPKPSETGTTPKVAAKPGPKKPSPVVPSEEQRKLAESQAMALKLISDNALLQQEMAKAQGMSFTEIATPDAALAELLAGNKRFVAGKRIRTLLSMQDGDLRGVLAKGEAPFAVVVACSDSRMVDNLIFDQELGRLFTLRNAGNCADAQTLASIEYALQSFGAKLVIVVGHSNCGAVKLVQEAHGKPLPGNLWTLQSSMAGLLESTPEDPNETEAEHADRLVAANTLRQAQAIQARSETVRRLVAGGKVKVVSAMYDLESGLVKILENPTAPSVPVYH